MTTRIETLIESLPYILVLHLKRFIYNNSGGVTKLFHHVQYDHEFIIRPGTLNTPMMYLFVYIKYI
jgi:hypothetical protein